MLCVESWLQSEKQLHLPKKLGLVEADVNQRASRFASFINMALLGLIAYLVLSYC